MYLTFSELCTVGGVAAIVGGIAFGLTNLNGNENNEPKQQSAQVAPSEPIIYTKNTQPIAHVPVGKDFGWDSVPGDFDGDGDLDFITGAGSDRDGSWNNGLFHIVENLGNGIFAEPRPIIYAEHQHVYDNSLMAGDFDGDGDLDLIIGVQGNSDDKGDGKFYFFKNDGKGNFRTLSEMEFRKNMAHAYDSEAMVEIYDEDGSGELNGKEFDKFRADQKKREK